MELCEFHIVLNGNLSELVLDCKMCHLKYDRENRGCLDHIIKTMEKEFDINSIIMKNYFQTQFQPEAVQLIKKIVSIRSDLHTLEGRNPPFQASTSQKKNRSGTVVDTTCEKCRVRPSRIFSGLYNSFLPDFDIFFETLQMINNDLTGFIINIQRSSTKKKSLDSCKKCLGETYKDLTYLFIQYQELAKYIVFKGFSVVVE